MRGRFSIYGSATLRESCCLSPSFWQKELMENHQALNGKKAIIEKELMRGHDMANQLLQVLLVHNDNNKYKQQEEEEKSSKLLLVPLAEDLVRKVLKSFTNTLFLLNTNSHTTTTHNEVLKKNCTKPDDETCKSKSIITTKNRRGCYKRKSSAPTWEKDSSILCDDGHAWRKYGQKRTLNSKYLRSYYRCTYKNEQGCEAMKQVQRIEDDPPLYRTTYYGHHTCTNYSMNPNEIELEPASSFESSTLLNFSCNTNSNTLPNKQAQPISSSMSYSLTKEEPIEIIPNDHNQLHSSNNDLHLLLCDYELCFDY